MRAQIISDLSAHLDPAVVEALLETYEQLITKHRSGDLPEALTKAGRFVEHALRLIEGKRTGSTPTEIKSVAATVKALEAAAHLPESLQLLIPRALYGMIYNIRSKRNAVHVKEIDPTGIDVAMAVAGASWVIAELLRLYHVSDDALVQKRMIALARTSLPFIEAIDGETFVGRNVHPTVEILLLLAHAAPSGMSRKEIGVKAKCSAPSVTKGLQALLADRFIHKNSSAQFFITTGGEAHLALQIQKVDAYANA